MAGPPSHEIHNGRSGNLPIHPVSPQESFGGGGSCSQFSPTFETDRVLDGLRELPCTRSGSGHGINYGRTAKGWLRHAHSSPNWQKKFPIASHSGCTVRPRSHQVGNITDGSVFSHRGHHRMTTQMQTSAIEASTFIRCTRRTSSPPSDSNPASFGVLTTAQTAESAGSRTGQVALRIDF